MRDLSLLIHVDAFVVRKYTTNQSITLREADFRGKI